MTNKVRLTENEIKIMKSLIDCISDIHGYDGSASSCGTKNFIDLLKFIKFIKFSDFTEKELDNLISAFSWGNHNEFVENYPTIKYFIEDK